jgi:1-acyl-sn-glycerol-3-phosphate acyltransferase
VEQEATGSVKPINVREVFKAKNPRLARVIPGFIYRFINSVMEIEFINNLIKRHGHHLGIEFINKVVEEFNVTIYIHGMENVPDSGRFIFASNHPLGGFDGMLLLKAVDEKLGKARFLTNDVLMNIPQLKPLFVPVNKHGGHSREAARVLSETYKSDAQILIFPAGLASRKIKGKIMDLEWKKHFISKAVSYNRDIIPVFVAGRNSNTFYRVARLRKLLRIKWNLEMFLLPGETVRHQNTDVFIYFGKPIPHTTFDSSKTHQEWAQWVKDKVYELSANATGRN